MKRVPPVDDPVRAFIVGCLERIKRLLTALDRLETFPKASQQRQQVRENIRRELEAADDVIKLFSLQTRGRPSAYRSDSASQVTRPDRARRDE